MSKVLRFGEVWFLPNEKALHHKPNVPTVMHENLASLMEQRGEGRRINGPDDVETEAKPEAVAEVTTSASVEAPEAAPEIIKPAQKSTKKK